MEANCGPLLIAGLIGYDRGSRRGGTTPEKRTITINRLLRTKGASWVFSPLGFLAGNFRFRLMWVETKRPCWIRDHRWTASKNGAPTAQKKKQTPNVIRYVWRLHWRRHKTQKKQTTKRGHCPFKSQSKRLCFLAHPRSRIQNPLETDKQTPHNRTSAFAAIMAIESSSKPNNQPL